MQLIYSFEFDERRGEVYIDVFDGMLRCLELRQEIPGDSCLFLQPLHRSDAQLHSAGGISHHMVRLGDIHLGKLML